MNNDLRPINTLPNFKRFCMTIGELPTSYLETMTYYEMLVWFTEYMKNTIIPTINNNGLAVQELQDKYIELKTFVDNYFDNLDVQEEINNKLDQMVQDGTLQEIITSYLNSKAVFGFDNVESMKNSTNLINGSYAKTLGYYSINDDGGATYKIRNITNEDIVDEMFLLSLNNNTLIAELIDDEINIKQLGAKGDNVNDDTLYIQSALNKKDGRKIIIPSGDYKITQTLRTYANNYIKMEFNTYLHIANIDGIYLDGNSAINGGTIITPNNYNHNVITILPCSITKKNEKIGGLWNLSIKNTTQFNTDSVGIACSFTDNDGVESDGITYMTFENIYIEDFEYGIKFTSSNNAKWVTSLNFDNLKMAYCKKFIYANMGREFTGNKFTNVHLQLDKDNLDYIIYLGGKCEDNYFNIIEWDASVTQNPNTIYLSNRTLNNKIEADRLYNYGLLKLVQDLGQNNYITSAFIENTHLARTNMKYIDFTGLDNTKAYPVLFENMCNIKIWKNSETGFPNSYLYAYIDAVTIRAGTMFPSYFVRMATAGSQQLIPKIVANSSNRYIAVYLRGGFKYNFLDYNYQYQETNSVEYYYSDELKDPYKKVTTSYTSGGITYEPIDLTNSIPNGMYFATNTNINLDSSSTPLNLS